MKENWKKYLPIYIISILIVLLPMIIGGIFYKTLPEQVPTHFSLTGKANGFTAKAMFVFIDPLINLAGQLLIVLGFLFTNKKCPKALEMISYWIFPLVSIITTYLVFSAVGIFSF